MKHNEFATDVKHTLENDIKKCLIDTNHITAQHSILLHTQSVCLYPSLSYRGTFKAIKEEEITLGEFRAAVTSYGLGHWFGRPLYDLRVCYDGESILNKGSLFHKKYIRVPLFNP